MVSVMPRVGSNWLKMGQKAMVSAIWSIDIAMLNLPPKYCQPDHIHAENNTDSGWLTELLDTL